MMMFGSALMQQQQQAQAQAQAQAAQAQAQQFQQQQQQQQTNLQNQNTPRNPNTNTNPSAATNNPSTTTSSSSMSIPPSSSPSSSYPPSSNSSSNPAPGHGTNPVANPNNPPAAQQPAAPPAPPAPPANPSDDARLEAIILAYLKRRGHSNAHDALKAAVTANSPAAANDIHAFAAELSLDQHTHLLKQVLHFSLQENSPDAYTTAFDSLKRWTSECLDVYRQELFGIQWPIYVHIFLQLVHRGFPTDAQRFLARFRSEHESLHRAEIHQFQNLTTDSELQKCDIARWFTQRKAEVQMSSFAHHLLISFLQENNCMLLLKIVNDHISIKVMSRKPLNLEEDGPLQATGGVSRAPASVTGTLSQPSSTPLNPLAISYLNTTPIRWGVLPEVAGLRKTAREKLREKLSAELLEMKKLRNKEIEQKFQLEEEARKEKEKEAAAQAAAISQAAKDEEADGEEGATAAATTGARKKARTSTTPASASADAAAGGGDTEMTDAAAGEEGTEGVEAAKRRKPKRKEAAPPTESLKETAKEKEVLDEITRELIKPAESMVLPRKEELVVKLPPLSADAKAKYIADLGQRARLSSSSLPSICFYTFINALHSVNSINISPDAALVSCGLSDSTVRLYDLRDPAIRQSTNPQAAAYEAKQSEAMDTGFDSMASIDIIHGSSMVGSRRDDFSSLPYSKLVGHSGPVYSTSLSPCNKYLLSGSEDATVRLWHLESKRNLVVYKGHNYPIWDVAFAPLGYYFATASSDGTARLWATQHVSPLRMFVGHNSDVDVVKFHPNNNYVATGSSDSTARLWDVQSGECVRLFVGHEGGVRSLAMDPEGRYMATGGEDGRVLIWDLGSGRQVSACQAHTAAVTSLEYSADATVIASGSLDHSIQLLEPKKASALKSIKTFYTKKTPVHYLSFTPRNLLLAAGVFNA